MDASHIDTAHQIAVDSVKWATQAITFIESFVGDESLSEEVVSWRLDDVGQNKKELLGTLAELFDALKQTKVRFRRAHEDVPSEFPPWLQEVSSAHEAALAWAEQMAATVHDALSGPQGVMEKSRILGDRVRRIPPLDLLPALEAEYRLALASDDNLAMEIEPVGEIVVVTLSGSVRSTQDHEYLRQRFQRLVDDDHCNFILDCAEVVWVSEDLVGPILLLCKLAESAAKDHGKQHRRPANREHRFFTAFENRDIALDEMADFPGHGWVVLCSITPMMRKYLQVTKLLK